ncbi:MAG TPA: HIT domain-containing protein [Candidatus Obscuribacterales bacterium]
MSDCLICRRHKDSSRAPLVVYEDDLFKVSHSIETNILGYFSLETRRHVLHPGEFSKEEATAYGRVLSNLMAAMSQVVDCHRIYTFSLSETVPHFHVHVIPRREDFPRAYSGRGITQYPVQPPADPALVQEVCSRVRRILTRTNIAVTCAVAAIIFSFTCNQITLAQAPRIQLKPTAPSQETPLVIDCRSPVAIQQSTVNGDSSMAGLGAGVSGIADSGIIISCDKVYRCLDKIPAAKAQVAFDWYHNVKAHRQDQLASRRKCMMIMMQSDWDKLQKMSGLKIPLGEPKHSNKAK